MPLEVEQKFRQPHTPEFFARLSAAGVTWGATEQQADLYFRHPSRDFAQTDEALRIRRIGSENHITYKGPKLDAQTKTRREIELPLAPGEAGFASWRELLEALGFSLVTVVEKQRRNGDLAWRGRTIHVALDEVTEVGQFVELELIAEAQSLDACRCDLLALAESLGLSDVERRSYLELLLTSRGVR